MASRWPHEAARAALRAALASCRPQAVVEDVAAGLRAHAHARRGSPKAFVHVGPGIYRWLLGLEQSAVYRGANAAVECGRDLARALDRACATNRLVDP